MGTAPGRHFRMPSSPWQDRVPGPEPWVPGLGIEIALGPGVPGCYGRHHQYGECFAPHLWAGPE